jgi:hypothetical protein
MGHVARKQSEAAQGHVKQFQTRQGNDKSTGHGDPPASRAWPCQWRLDRAVADFPLPSSTAKVTPRDTKGRCPGSPRRMNDRTSGATALPPIRMLRLSLPLRRSTYLTPAVTLFRSLFYHPEHHPPASPQRPNRDNPQRRQRSCIQIKHPRIISVTTRRKPHDTITSRRSSLGRAVHVPHGPRSCSVGDRSSDKGQGEDRTGTSYSLLHAQNLTTRLGSRDA